jgi:LCP family protein required for cell wall assembly
MTADESASPPSRWNGFLGRCVISLAVVSALVITGVAATNREIDDRVAKISRVKLTLADPPPGGANFLIIGSDTRAFVDNPDLASQFGDPNADPNVEGQRSDTLMVAHVEPSSQRTFVVSFPRDLMVDVPGLPGKNRINSAYASGGAQRVIDTLKANFDIDISHYLEVDFKSFQEIVDAIGNVQVYLPGRTRDLETGLSTPYGAGCYPLDGGAALAYVRARNLQVSDPNGTIVDDFPPYEHWRLLDIRADLDRIVRQQSFIRKLSGIAIQKALGDPFLAVSLADNVIGYLKADQALSRDDVNALIRAFKTVDVNDSNSIRFETIPVDPDPDNPNVTLVPSADAESVLAQLRTFGDATPKIPTVLPAQVTVKVTDATGTNVGASAASELAANGFKATATAPARATVPVSEIHYGYGQAEEAKALLAFVADAKLVPDPKANDAVHLVLGASFQALTVPSTTTTLPGTAATTTTLPTTTTTTIAPAPTDPCP